MSLTLSELQANFASALHYQASGEDCGITSDHFSAEQRIQIYRNNFIISLQEVLAATYPVTLALLGEECFNQVARHYVLTHPLEQGDVTQYGEQFDASLNAFSQIQSAAPYINTIAKFEWKMDQVRYVNDDVSPRYPLEALAELDVELHPNVTFTLHKNVELLTSNYAVFSLYQAVKQQELEGLDIHNQESGVIVCGSEGIPWYQVLDNNSFQLLQKMQRQYSLSEIPPKELASLNELITLHLISGFDLKP
ncbi:DNA-binding domain-containing protein [Vibrio maerlii]|uniref:HvfC/BufC N-terminal domain-containing protein n=1 Tax=Vibrio maerlii TaxID=2231648 RepID=UPI000E3BD2DE|nr:DNA-binding domain-containing protein [Vibrio maerlii]